MKRLYRPKTERLLGGVCSGIGQYFDTDPNLIRIVWVVLTLLSIGVGVIAYLIAWLIIPEEEDDRAEVISVT
ncbi:MAG TPA: PspC domain-containing protein [Methanoregulaceae archaeon]|nr:PspC domain-containing protein [Methanoregulaceae archaeon]HPX73077.1 PspC domain-containing protein [Methanoregulaceae archaeon]HQA80956.1 PspC domain-containing protein [Methanoregulaceae archaeon]